MSGRSDAIVVFGATGDLARKSIFPALFGLASEDRLPHRIVGVALEEWSREDLHGYASRAVEEHGDRAEGDGWRRLTDRLDYVAGDYNDERTYERLRDALEGGARPLFYLAIPPSLFERVVQGLAAVDLHRDARLVIEKPFGRDLASARELNRCVLDVFPEDAVHRIDHFLGKEQMLDLLVFRLANTFLEPAWNRHYIESVQITMAEDFGVEGRGGFYDETGALRDVFQNHLLQVIAQVAMEPPASADADALRDEKVKVLRSMPSLTTEEVVRGQFDGYRDEDGVGAASEVETFVAVRAHIDSWRWAGVPFHVRAGKELPVTATDVLVEFRQPPRLFFSRADCPPPHPNHLLFRLKPGEHVSISVQIKEPGDALVSRPVELAYEYDERREGRWEQAYARLLDDAMDGDQRLFARADGVEEAWRVIEPVLAEPPPVHRYGRGSWGPEAAADLAPAGGWHDPEAAPDA